MFILPIEDTIVDRIRGLIAEGQVLREGNEYGQVKYDEHEQACQGWLAAAKNIVQIVVPDSKAAYRLTVDKVESQKWGKVINQGVGEIGEILQNLLRDAQSGLVSSVVDQTRAEVFDDFLDHAESYLQEGRKNPAGVISGGSL